MFTVIITSIVSTVFISCLGVLAVLVGKKATTGSLTDFMVFVWVVFNGGDFR